jgi:hypothetical protein
MRTESVFVRTNHLFLRNPRGGVEDVATMAASGFGAVFCNVGDYPPDEWATVRSRAVAAGVACGPWLRVAEEGTGAFDPERLGFLLDVADEWASPLIVNAEAELKGSGSDITEHIADEVKGRDAALSMEPWPFSNVDWRPVGHMPILPQLFGEQWGKDAEAARTEWFRCGVECVVNTFGTYGGSTPAMYDRLSPFGLYTADDCGNVFAPWEPLGTRNPYAPETPTNGGDVETIGDQDGITSAMNRLRDLDPNGTLLVKTSGKWPELSTLTQPLSNWKAYDKLQRTLTILKTDHDAEVS